MENCLICNSSPELESSFCHKCGFPAGAIVTDPNLRQAALKWIHEKCAVTHHSDITNDIGCPASKKNEQIASVQSLESFMSELTELKLQVEKVESQQLKIDEKNNILSQLKSLNQSIKLIQNESTMFVKQQVDKTQKLEGHIQANQKITENYISKSCLEREQQMADINNLKSILNNRHVNQSTPKAVNLVMSLNSPGAISSDPDLGFASEELDLLRDYNSNYQELPNLLREQATNVSIDDESFARLRNGDESNIGFKPDRKGNYLVILRGGYRYLLPNRQPRIITQIYVVTKVIYKCDGYSENYRDFRLIKPALVLEKSIDRWKLSRKGILEFI